MNIIMKRIRQGNTINFRYSVYRSIGELKEPEDLTGVAITATLQNRLYGTQVDVPFSIEGNVITGQIPGIPHLRTGVYNFCLCYQKDGTDFAVDTDAFQIVDSSSKTGGESACPHVEAETVELKGVVEFGIVGSGGIEQVQADWKEIDPLSKAYIKNKPILATVATSGSYNDLKDKPSGLNVPTKTSDLINDSGFIADTNYVHTDNNYTTPEKEKLAGLENYDDTAVKTSIFANTVAINAEVTRAKQAETALSTSLGTKVDKVEDKGLSTNDYTTVEKNKLAGIAEGAEVNVNADWNATEGDARILNKPNIVIHSKDATGTVDLNGILGYGMFTNTRDNNATPEHNYPIQRAGLLIYGSSANERTNQIYSSYSNNRWFARSAGATAHTPWKEFTFLEDLPVAAKTGSYNDLTNKPTIPTVDVTKKYVDDQITAVNTTLNTKVNSSLVGANSGIAQLDNTGKVPSSQLPSYVDDVLEFPTLADFPPTGESGKIYVTADTNITYRWTGTDYVEISKSLALGETSSTAYAGDKGKKNATDIATLSTRVTTAESDLNTAEAAILALDSKFTNYSTTVQNDLKYAPKATTYSKAEVDTLVNAKLDVSTYTAQDVLNKIKTVDGTGSGLDADLLGGKQASEYALKTEVPSSVTVDAALSTISQNPVQNKVITAAINTIKYDAIVHLPAATGYFKIADIDDSRNMTVLLNLTVSNDQTTILLSMNTNRTIDVLKLNGSGLNNLYELQINTAPDKIAREICIRKQLSNADDLYVSFIVLASNPLKTGSASSLIHPGTITFLDTAAAFVVQTGWTSFKFYLRDSGPVSNQGINATLFDGEPITSFLTEGRSLEFTPTLNYEPATKKYVDDSVKKIPVEMDLTDWYNQVQADEYKQINGLPGTQAIADLFEQACQVGVVPFTKLANGDITFYYYNLVKYVNENADPVHIDYALSNYIPGTEKTERFEIHVGVRGTEVTVDLTYAASLSFEQKQDRVFIQNATVTSSAAVYPNRYYKFPSITTADGGLSVILLAQSNVDSAGTEYINEYMFEFTAADDNVPFSIENEDTTIPIKWINEPTITAGKTYQVSVVNSLAVIGGA